MSERADNMRSYEEKELKEVCCNRCGRKLKVEGGVLKEGCFKGNSLFGYFSRRDGIRHSFDLCEDCYDDLLQTFSIPVEEIEETELC